MRPQGSCNGNWGSRTSPGHPGMLLSLETPRAGSQQPPSLTVQGQRPRQPRWRETDRFLRCGSASFSFTAALRFPEEQRISQKKGPGPSASPARRHYFPRPICNPVFLANKLGDATTSSLGSLERRKLIGESMLPYPPLYPTTEPSAYHSLGNPRRGTGSNLCTLLQTDRFLHFSAICPN